MGLVDLIRAATSGIEDEKQRAFIQKQIDAAETRGEEARAAAPAQAAKGTGVGFNLGGGPASAQQPTAVTPAAQAQATRQITNPYTSLDTKHPATANGRTVNGGRMLGAARGAFRKPDAMDMGLRSYHTPPEEADAVAMGVEPVGATPVAQPEIDPLDVPVVSQRGLIAAVERAATPEDTDDATPPVGIRNPGRTPDITQYPAWPSVYKQLSGGQDWDDRDKPFTPPEDDSVFEFNRGLTSEQARDVFFPEALMPGGLKKWASGETARARVRQLEAEPMKNLLTQMIGDTDPESGISNTERLTWTQELARMRQTDEIAVSSGTPLRSSMINVRDAGKSENFLTIHEEGEGPSAGTLEPGTGQQATYQNAYSSLGVDVDASTAAYDRRQLDLARSAEGFRDIAVDAEASDQIGNLWQLVVFANPGFQKFMAQYPVEARRIVGKLIAVTPPGQISDMLRQAIDDLGSIPGTPGLP